MPNWCDNVIIIKGEPEFLSRFKETLNGPDSQGEIVPFSFYHTVKNNENNQPQTFDMRDIMSGKVDMYPNVKIWGVKWDASDPEIVINDENEVHVRCRTAWSPPIQWAKTVHKDWNIDITIHYAEEGTQNYGSYEINNKGVSDMKYKMNKDIEYNEESGEYDRKGDYKEFCDKWFDGIPKSG